MRIDIFFRKRGHSRDVESKFSSQILELNVFSYLELNYTRLYQSLGYISRLKLTENASHRIENVTWKHFSSYLVKPVPWYDNLTHLQHTERMMSASNMAEVMKKVFKRYYPQIGCSIILIVLNFQNLKVALYHLFKLCKKHHILTFWSPKKAVFIGYTVTMAI